MTYARLAGVTLALLAPAATANAATLQTDLPCYVGGQAMAFQGTGWGPNSAWGVASDPAGLASSGTADATGTFLSPEGTLAPTLVDSDTTTPETFTLTGQQDGQDVASTTFQVVNFSVVPKARNGKPTKKTTWRFSGFQPGQAIYFHVIRKGKVHTQRVGKASSPCGTFTRKLRRLPAWPAKHIAYGKYKIAVDSRKAYSKGNGQFTAIITIYKTYVR